MKSKCVIIGVIALLSVWAIIATMAAVWTEESRISLVEQKEELMEEVKSQEKAYKQLEKEYAELEKEREEYREKFFDSNANYTFHLAYEWLFDMLCNSENEEYDADAALDEICEREGLGLLDRLWISQQAQEILSEYGVETE